MYFGKHVETARLRLGGWQKELELLVGEHVSCAKAEKDVVHTGDVRRLVSGERSVESAIPQLFFTLSTVDRRVENNPATTFVRRSYSESVISHHFL